jgi:hypothetical protein
MGPYQLPQRSARGSLAYGKTKNSGTASAYKDDVNDHAGNRPALCSRLSSCRIHVVVVIIAVALTMVSLYYILRSAAVLAPLASIVAGAPGYGKSFPSLAEATTEELVAGLKAKHFTSVDLVDVR